MFLSYDIYHVNSNNNIMHFFDSHHFLLSQNFKQNQGKAPFVILISILKFILY